VAAAAPGCGAFRDLAGDAPGTALVAVPFAPRPPTMSLTSEGALGNAERGTPFPAVGLALVAEGSRPRRGRCPPFFSKLMDTARLEPGTLREGRVGGFFRPHSRHSPQGRVIAAFDLRGGRFKSGRRAGSRLQRRREPAGARGALSFVQVYSTAEGVRAHAAQRRTRREAGPANRRLVQGRSRRAQLDLAGPCARRRSGSDGTSGGGLLFGARLGEHVGKQIVPEEG